MNYQEALQFIQATNKFGSVLGLDNIKELLNRLDNPQNKLKVVHIAGTNGKGSTLAFLASVFKESGYKAGRYVSPASFCYEERFRINEENISKDDLCYYMELLKNVSEEMVDEGKEHPTMFEIETALSFIYFYDQKVDVVLLETGMGGRLDATNVVEKPICVAIASIGYDHMAYLGNTLVGIATEKAGIIKEGSPVVSYDNGEKINDVIEKIAKENHTLVVYGKKENTRVLSENLDGQSFSYRSSHGRWYPKINISLLGEHQIANAILALEVLEKIKNYYCISEFQIEEGFRNAIWRGRLELLQEKPYILCDGAHNEDGAKALKKFTEKSFTNRRIIYIIGVLGDKEYEKMIKETYALAEVIYTVTPDNDRALSGEKLAQVVRKYHNHVECRHRLRECLQEVKDSSLPEDVIIVFGTLSFQNEL